MYSYFPSCGISFHYNSFTLHQLDLWAPVKRPNIISLWNSIWFQLIPFTFDFEVKYVKRSCFLLSSSLKCPFWIFFCCPHSPWTVILTDMEASPTTWNIFFYEQEWTGLGDSLKLCHLLHRRKERRTYLPRATNPQLAGICPVQCGGQMPTRGAILKAYKGPRLACLYVPPSPSTSLLPSFPPSLSSFLLMSRELFCQITSNLQEMGSLCTCVSVNLCSCVCACVCEEWRWGLVLREHFKTMGDAV